MSRPPHGDVLQIPTPPLQRTALIIIFIFPAFSILFFSLRSYGRITTRQFGLDDWLCGLALLFALLMTPPMFMYIKLGYFGWRAVDVPPDFDMSPGLWWNFLVQMFYNPVLALVKASILVFLSRLGGHRTSVRNCIIALHCLNTGHAVSVFFTALLQCLPMEANWNFMLRFDPNSNVKCIDNSFHVIASCLTILTDFLILALPFWIFLGLRMPWAAKLAVIGVFLMGSVVAIVGIIRVIDIYKLFFTPFDPTVDHFHNIVLVYSNIEVNLAIICACIPALRPLFRRWFPGLFGGSSANSAQPFSGHTFGSSTRGDASNGGTNNITLKSLRSDGSHRTEIRGASPTGSEEEIMTYNGIIRTANVNVAYENASFTDSRYSAEEKSARRSNSRQGMI
ncbi:hypothetical protein F5X68DRAFT_234448 [Plectosphaerella plurivora]|uniref:Rhodopsin domain-containing protein n=1 Tax=Plectosphaerella plurivora TaxID=936078 RepID=A0A9P8V7B2_9PEZI|nr:hypothetical protein F5X68DRAFT_234448 [Plectosphaerella plurivora]